MKKHNILLHFPFWIYFRDHVDDFDDDNDGILDIHDEDDDGDGIFDLEVRANEGNNKLEYNNLTLWLYLSFVFRIQIGGMMKPKNWKYVCTV